MHRTHLHGVFHTIVLYCCLPALLWDCGFSRNANNEEPRPASTTTNETIHFLQHNLALLIVQVFANINAWSYSFHIAVVRPSPVYALIFAKSLTMINGEHKYEIDTDIAAEFSSVLNASRRTDWNRLSAEIFTDANCNLFASFSTILGSQNKHRPLHFSYIWFFISNNDKILRNVAQRFRFRMPFPPKINYVFHESLNQKPYVKASQPN